MQCNYSLVKRGDAHHCAFALVQRSTARLQGMGSVCLLMEGWQCGSNFIAWKTNVMEVLASDPLGDRGGVQGGVSQFRT